MAGRFFLYLAAFCCLTLLVPPVQGRLGIGLVGDRSSSGGSDKLVGGTTVKKATPAWSSSWTPAGTVRPELRSVPGGPDPLHHHDSPRRPEMVEPTSP